MNFKTEHRTPTVSEYQQLRASTDWGKLDDATVTMALSNSQFAVCIMEGDKIAASGRIIGDGAYLYIQDVIVLPAYQAMGLGKKVMVELENWLEKTAAPNSFIGLMAASGTTEFYKKFHYEVRENHKPGMHKIKGTS